MICRTECWSRMTKEKAWLGGFLVNNIARVSSTFFYDDKKNWTQSALNESQTVQACYYSLHVQVAEGLKMKVS